jgi:hypothetical protein
MWGDVGSTPTRPLFQSYLDRCRVPPVKQQGHALRMRLDLAALDGEPDEACRLRGIRRTIG